MGTVICAFAHLLLILCVAHTPRVQREMKHFGNGLIMFKSLKYSKHKSIIIMSGVIIWYSGLVWTRTMHEWQLAIHLAIRVFVEKGLHILNICCS